jgi:hypothetical protein
VNIDGGRIFRNGDRRVVDISAMDTYFRVKVCTPIFMGEASN